MIINQCNGIIETLDNQTSFEGSKLETDILPSLCHLIQVMLDIELLHRLLSDLDTALDVLHQTHTQSSREGEILVWLDFYSDAF